MLSIEDQREDEKPIWENFPAPAFTTPPTTPRVDNPSSSSDRRWVPLEAERAIWLRPYTSSSVGPHVPPPPPLEPPLGPLEPAAEQRPRSQQEERGRQPIAYCDHHPVDAPGIGAKPERGQVLHREVGRAVERGERDCIHERLARSPHQPLAYFRVGAEEPYEANDAEERQATAPALWRGRHAKRRRSSRVPSPNTARG